MTRTLVLGFGLMLTLGACAELQSGKPGEVPLRKCAADVHQDWVGQRVDFLNDVALPEGARVLFPTTPATSDFRADRLNIAVDKADTIARVYCG